MIIEWSEIVEFQYNNHQIYAWGDVLITRRSYFYELKRIQVKTIHACSFCLILKCLLLKVTEILKRHQTQFIKVSTNSSNSSERRDQGMQFINNQIEGDASDLFQKFAMLLRKRNIIKETLHLFTIKLKRRKKHFNWLTKGDRFGNLFCNPRHFPQSF